MLGLDRNIRFDDELKYARGLYKDILTNIYMMEKKLIMINGYFSTGVL